MITPDSPLSVVVEPALPYAELSGRLRALEWQWRREAQSAPLLPGEPEYVVWALPNGAATLIYTFNPAIFLRVLRFSGPQAKTARDRTTSFVQHLTLGRVGELLAATDVESCVLGLFAARELELFASLPQIHELCESPDEFIAEIAEEVAASLENMLLVRAREAVQEFRRSAHEPPSLVLFGAPKLRRQIVRQAAAAAGVLPKVALHAVLGAALVDTDWEVRASAMVLAARAGFAEGRALIAPLAFTAEDGVHSADLRPLRDLQRAVLSELAEGAAPSGERTVSASTPRGQQPHRPASGDAELRHARCCVMQGEDGLFDATFLLAHALGTPLELSPRSDARPPCVRVTESGFVLARSNIELVRVGALACWLGDPAAPADPPNPLRRIVPQTEFFISRDCVPGALVAGLLGDAAATLAGGEPDASGGTIRGGEGPPAHPARHDRLDAHLTYAEALRAIRALSLLEGAAIALPGPDQWQMAARGPDGRRYPWGASKTPPSGDALSPWAMAGLELGRREWVRSTEAAALACGGPTLECGERAWATQGEQLPFRVVVAIETT